MATELSIKLVTGSGYLVVELDGEMDLASVQPIRERLLTIAATVPGVVILDLEHVKFLDSTALGLFISMHRTLEQCGAQLVLINVDHVVGKPITLTAVDQVLTVHWADDAVRPDGREAFVRRVRDGVPVQLNAWTGQDEPDESAKGASG